MNLPQLVDPYDCLRQRAVFDGELTTQQLPRLSSLLSSPSAGIQFRLAFDSDGGRRCVLDCCVKASLHLICQRCGQEMTLPVESHSKLVIVKNDQQAGELSEAYDPLMTNETGSVALLDVIEDELLLAIPMIPRHLNSNCLECVIV